MRPCRIFALLVLFFISTCSANYEHDDTLVFKKPTAFFSYVMSGTGIFALLAQWYSGTYSGQQTFWAGACLAGGLWSYIKNYCDYNAELQKEIRYKKSLELLGRRRPKSRNYFREIKGES